MAVGAAVLLGIGLVAKSVQTGFNIDAINKQEQKRLNDLRNQIGEIEDMVDLNVYFIEKDMIEQVGTFNAAAAAEQVGGKSVELAQQSLALQAGFNVAMERGAEQKQIDATYKNMENVREEADRARLNEWLNIAGGGLATGAQMASELQAKAPTPKTTPGTEEVDTPEVGK